MAYDVLVANRQNQALQKTENSDKMTNMLRKLPLSGVQDFSKIRTEYAVYVDKTAYIHSMITNYNFVFFSRPRRFGKSLTCSAIKAVFENKKELFSGLAIENLPWEWKEYPVLHLDLSAANFTAGKDRLIEHINGHLDYHGSKYDISLNDKSISGKFKDLLIKINKKRGRVVIIIDEYDCPLLDTLNYPEIHSEIKEELRGFYKVLKECDQYIQFTFITGITKFAQVSMFSGMNQPEDISFNDSFASLCGFTQNEVETYFEPEINEYSKKFDSKDDYLAKLKNFYNGYKFSEEADRVYNPISILKHFGNKGKFNVYWAETGTPSYLAKYIDKNGADIADIENIELSVEAFSKYNENELLLVPLMYQSGYLTIDSYNDESGKFKLNFPNTEVRSSFAEFLSKQYSGLNIIKRESHLNKLFHALKDGDVNSFIENIKTYMQSIKFDLITKITEYYFEFAFSNVLNMLGFNCEIEVHSAVGSVDAVIKFKKNVFVIEAKLDKSVEEALKQIEEKKYYVPYMNKGYNIFKIGIVFGEKERNIIDWKCADY